MPGPLLCGTMTRAIDFFKLLFTTMAQICVHTNAYGWKVICDKSWYGDKHGAWVETTAEELEKVIGLLIYFSLVKVSTFHRYWSTKTLYHGLWARSLTTRERFKAIMATLHVIDPDTEIEKDKLRKVRVFAEQIQTKCKSLYQPFRHVAVDERMDGKFQAHVWYQAVHLE